MCGFSDTFISSKLAGKIPGLRFESELFGRAGDGATGRGGGGGAAGRDTMMEVGRLLALLWPSATGLQQRKGCYTRKSWHDFSIM